RAVKSSTKIKTLVSEEDAPLMSALKAKRRALAEAQNVPAYIIFPDRTLIEMAEKRPQTLDDLARIGGIGAKKLESYGAAFLQVLAGAQAPVHPMRRKLAGRDQATVYDRLMAAQSDLSRGVDGTGKPMTCSASQISKLAQLHRPDMGAIQRIIGDRHTDRFGDRFLEILREA
ncbi:MAG: ATP-dependent DNA helicase RecQ, partial [Rhodobacteraceae bacterium]|nr:ATP-dependent DNA helicase RecQ [Paracoccaceae bacterium]